MNARKTSLIIGGGVIGAAIAARLGPDRKVILIDAGMDADNASQGSLAWLNASSSTDADYVRLRAKSMDLWHALAAEADCPVHMRGSLMWGGDMGKTAKWLRGLGFEAEEIGEDKFRKLAPGVASPPVSTLFAPTEGAADPLKITDWFLGRANVERISGSVAALIHEERRVTGARLLDGRSYFADDVIVAAGCGTPALMAPLGVTIEMKSSPGILVHTSPAPMMTGPVLATPELDFWQKPDGRILVATGVSAHMTGGPDEAVASALQTLRTMMPKIGDIGVELTFHRNRPIPADGFPAIGRPAGVEGVYAIVTHSGMTLAPIIAEAVAADLAGAPAPHDLLRYRLDRDYGAVSEERPT